jgi:hypothetical protein
MVSTVSCFPFGICGDIYKEGSSVDVTFSPLAFIMPFPAKVKSLGLGFPDFFKANNGLKEISCKPLIGALFF